MDSVSRDVVSRVRDSFGLQGLMKTLGAELSQVAAGRVHIALPYSAALTQQHGYFHAAATTAIADTAGGYAAMTLMEPGEEVLAVEFKVNLVRPARGDRLEARASVVRAGRTLVISAIDVFGITGASETLVATMLQTNIRVRGGDKPSADAREE